MDPNLPSISFIENKKILILSFDITGQELLILMRLQRQWRAQFTLALHMVSEPPQGLSYP